MRLDLCRVRVPVKAEFFDKTFCIGLPVNIRVGRQVRIIVANGAIDFTHYRAVGKLRKLALHAVHHVGQLFANRRRGGCLAVRA